MSKKSDLFTDNPEMYLSGRFEEIAIEIEREWWEDKRKKLTVLSGSLDFEIIEHLPEDLRNKLFGREISPQEFDEENPPEHSFLLQVFKRNKGKAFEIACNNKIRKETRKLTKKEKDETIEILHSLSEEPTGSLLPRQNNLKSIGGSNFGPKLEKIFGIRRNFHQKRKIKLYQYKCGRGLKKRLVWIIDKLNRQVILLFYGTRNKIDKIW